MYVCVCVCKCVRVYVYKDRAQALIHHLGTQWLGFRTLECSSNPESSSAKELEHKESTGQGEQWTRTGAHWKVSLSRDLRVRGH